MKVFSWDAGSEEPGQALLEQNTSGTSHMLATETCPSPVPRLLAALWGRH